MAEEMGTHLQQILGSLCFKTEWIYAIFWKLKHRTRMMLSWEDAYYDNHEPPNPSENMCLGYAFRNLHHGRHLQDPLGLAVAKMSYLVYSLGEGIIGQVAVTGRHQWIFADNPASSSWSSSEYCDGWLTQFSAGIRIDREIWLIARYGGASISKCLLIVYLCSVGHFLDGHALEVTAENRPLIIWPLSPFRTAAHLLTDLQTKTVAVVAVVPYGVVQLGSLNTVIEDLKLVTHIKDVFSSLQNSSIECLPNPIQCTTRSTLCLSKVSTRTSGLETFHDCEDRLDKSLSNKRPDIRPHFFPFLGRHNDFSQYVLPLPVLHQRRAVEVVNKHVEVESATSRGDESVDLYQSKSEIFTLEHQKELEMKLQSNQKCEEQTSGWRDADVGSQHNDTPASHDFLTENINLYNVTLPAEEPRADLAYFPSDLLGTAAWDRIKFDRVIYSQSGVLHLAEPLEMQLGKGSEQNLEFWTRVSHMDAVSTSLKFSAGCELHEALGPAFRKEQTSCAWNEGEKTGTEITVEPPDGLGCSQFKSECGSENLLEAVVANACHGTSNVESENSICKSVESLLITEKMPKTPSCIKLASSSAGEPIDQSYPMENSHHCLSSARSSIEVCTMRSPKELSTTTSEQLERLAKPAKINRKRTRPGENCRPRPRDRQLIQDRVKELRELVPNGSKCSIDSLLEQTIKHMLFLQSITKHADMLKKCAESKLHNKEIGLVGSCSRKHGSSWALEVGSQSKVCPIIVDNLNRSGQMLVEMLCEECCHFLEIAEAIRGLGLTILKGATDVRGEKTWACFVVEGKNNRVMHRMDILWSLMHLLQPKPRL
ncbi:hypothetical protein HHK36_026882 [Tetracentron sinense]|uniref:BHLH domain-containing protein n=1 Tax=Tetracentron sinense TaxID=13715 RepID=A0A835D321_TETSI|nr:hypothetical protein HHK36_026882 [Tetracentron sinense]